MFCTSSMRFRAFCILFSSLMCAAAETTPSNSSDPAIVQGRRIETAPSDKDKEFLTQLMTEFKRFDDLFVQRQTGQEMSAAVWLTMAGRFDPFKSMYLVSDRTWISPHLLRAQLLEGQCCLLAAMAYYHHGGNDSEFFEVYHRGLDQLEQVIRLSNEDIDYLPRYSFIFAPDPRRPWEVRVHPYAGYESVGTGFVYFTLDNSRQNAPPRVTQYDYTYYSPLELFSTYAESELNAIGSTIRTRLQERLDGREEPYYGFQQIHTSTAARQWLTSFCPWGVRIYRFMQAEGIIGRKELGVLRPFGTQKTDMSDVQLLLHAVGARTVEMLAEKPLQDHIPIHMQKELSQLIGTGQPMPSRPGQGLKWLKDAQGMVGPKPIPWRMVQAEPTYTAWLYSPTCFDMKTSEKLGWALKAVKLYFGGVAALVEDELQDVFVMFIAGMAGKDGLLHWISYIAVEQDNWGVPLLFDADIDAFGKSRKPLKEFSKLAFGHLEQKEIEWLYENIDPDKFRGGISYDGASSVPPIVLRGEVFGFEQAKPFKYQKNHRLVRYYRLEPAHLASSFADATYDLSKDVYPTLHWETTYRQGQETIQRWVWPAIANERDRSGRVTKPLGSRDYVTDYAPVAQIVDVHFDKDVFSRWQKHSGDRTKLSAGLYPPLNPEQLLESVELKEPRAVMEILNPDCWEADGTANRPKYDFPVYLHPQLGHLSSSLGPGGPGSMGRSPRLPQTEIFTEYILKIKDRSEELEQMRLVFVARPDQQVTGEVTYPAAGYAQLTYKPVPTDPRLSGYKRCSLSFTGFGSTMRSSTGQSRTTLPGDFGGPEFAFDVDGGFKGNVFEGTLLDVQDRPEDDYHSERSIRIHVTVDPETLDVTHFEVTEDFSEPRYEYKKVLIGKDVPATRITEREYNGYVAGKDLRTKHITTLDHTIDRERFFQDPPQEHQQLTDVACTETTAISITFLPAP